MFSLRQKRDISNAIQKILRDTKHPELPENEIQFMLHVKGAQNDSWANIKNNDAVINPSINFYNEQLDPKSGEKNE